MRKTFVKQILLGTLAAVTLCGCSLLDTSSSNETSSAEPTASAWTTAGAIAAGANYIADDFSVLVANRSTSALARPLNVMSLRDADNNALNTTMSDTNQKATYSCDDYDVAVSFSLMTDGVNNQTTVKYLIEVSDKTMTPSVQTSKIQEEIFDGLPDASNYEDGSAMINNIESNDSLTDEQKQAAKDAKKKVDETEHSDEWGTATSDGTVCVCSECGEEFATTSAWYNHIVDEHDGSGSYSIKVKTN